MPDDDYQALFIIVMIQSQTLFACPNDSAPSDCWSHSAIELNLLVFTFGRILAMLTNLIYNTLKYYNSLLCFKMQLVSSTEVHAFFFQKFYLIQCKWNHRNTQRTLPVLMLFYFKESTGIICISSTFNNPEIYLSLSIRPLINNLL